MPDWTKFYSREYGVQYTSLALRALSDEVKGFVPYTFYNQLFAPDNKNEACFISASDWAKLTAAIHSRYTSTLADLDNFQSTFVKFGEEYVRIARNIAGENLITFSNHELKNKYLEYQKTLLNYGAFVYMLHVVNEFVSESVKKLVEDKSKLVGKKDKSIEYIGVLIQPDDKASILLLQQKLRQLGRNASDNEMKKLYDEFNWMACLDIHNRPWTYEQFVDNMKIMLSSNLEKKYSVSYEEVIEELKLDHDEKELIAIAKKLAYLKDARDDYRRKGVFFAQKMFEEIGRRMKLTLEETSYLTEKEIVEFIEHLEIPRKDKIVQRRNGFLVFFDDSRNIVCVEGDEMDVKLKELGILENRKQDIAIKGTPASRGYAKGPVSIIKGVGDLQKVSRGDVLVAVTTHPDFVPAMKKAVAIVTDEGGLSSHAAIVSREFGIPCIVGTKNATHVLNDGDIVEVHSNEGTVKIVSKNSN